MSVPLVSAVIPTYNYGRFVVEAVESVLAQTFGDVEIVVVDDGSTDDTRRRLEPYLGRIRYIHQDNQGVSAARNAGVRAARGTYIAFLDADDVWHPTKLETQLRYFAEHPEVKVLAVGGTIDRSNGWPDIPTSWPPPTQAVPLDHLVIRSRFSTSGFMLRKECFDAVGLFRESMCGAEDRDMWIRIAAQFPIVLLDQTPLWFCRVHLTSLSHVSSLVDPADRRMLADVFDTLRQLRGCRLLRRKAFSYAAHMASLSYGASGNQPMALRRGLESLLQWPFAFEPGEPGPADRLKIIAVIVLRMMKLKRPHSHVLGDLAKESHA